MDISTSNGLDETHQILTIDMTLFLWRTSNGLDETQQILTIDMT